MTTNTNEETDEEKIYSSMHYICEKIFTNFHVLDTLSFNFPSSIHSVEMFFGDRRPSDRFCSSTLVKLKISVQCFEEFLYFLDGRFSQLQVVDVNISYLRRPRFVRNEVCCH